MVHVEFLTNFLSTFAGVLHLRRLNLEAFQNLCRFFDGLSMTHQNSPKSCLKRRNKHIDQAHMISLGLTQTEFKANKTVTSRCEKVSRFNAALLWTNIFGSSVYETIENIYRLICCWSFVKPKLKCVRHNWWLLRGYKYEKGEREGSS